MTPEATDGVNAGNGPERADAAAPGPGSFDGRVRQPSSSRGLDAVKSALAAARATARAQGVQPGDPPGSTQARRRGTQTTARGRRRDAGYTGAGVDRRDPQPFGPLIDQLLSERGWTHEVAVGGVMGRWAQIVGADISAHANPETFADGVLTIRTSSTAWATQMRLLAPRVRALLNAEVGAGVVRRIAVLAPAAPSWRRGPRATPGGRGPRDTYG